MEPEERVSFPALDPALQISFHYRLQLISDMLLRNALSRTVDALDLAVLDRELREFVAQPALKRLASFGLRGEVLFPVPAVLSANPFLLGYYRLLYGFSQKEFYSKGPFGRFKRLEEKGELPQAQEDLLVPLCRSLITAAEQLVTGLDQWTLRTIRDLQLLTLGPQLRGSENTRIGQTATREIFGLIREIVAPYAVEQTRNSLLVRNDAGRTVLIAFSSDPDIAITESLGSGSRPLVSIEIKGGGDVSNVHNRLGEAEKSHRKARNRGFVEFWTILRAKVSRQAARRESPTTTHFFGMDAILRPGAPERARFRDLLCSTLSIRSESRGPG